MRRTSNRTAIPAAAEREILAALDHAPLTSRHRLFVAALLAALVFDYMKPVTISFVIPGMRAMWELSETTASYLAVAGLTGTAVGSVFWGVLADRIGRKTTLLWTVAIFTVSSVCGLTMRFTEALAACFMMGFGVGGETPIVFALATEYLPVRVRGRVVLLLGIVGAVAGYALAALVAAGANALYEPAFAWRVMWLVNIVPALFILVLRSRVIPESARFLLSRGRVQDARDAAESLLGDVSAVAMRAMQHRDRPPIEGSEGATQTRTSRAATDSAPSVASSVRLYGRTVALAFFSFAWGLANFGFVIWLPTLLEGVGYSGAGSSAYLALSATVALPALWITVLLMTRWSTRWTLVAYAAAGGTVLVVLGAGATGGWLTPLVLVTVSSLAFFFITALGGAFSLYAAEVFPTRMRARRSGIVAAAGKAGGVIGPYFGGVWLAAGGSALGLQIPLAAALLAAALAVALAGVETRGLRLEQIGG